ncbi:MAG: GNAT family N-acetyltransferase [Rudanella sp.]|nr:GNAT family N-acetyltransferase [Rudanella sp.]
MTTITIQPITAEDTLLLRHSVLWPDKPFDYVRLPDDEQGQHVGGFVEGKLVAVISLFVDKPTAVARFRKFATHPNFQNQGIGTQLLNQVIGQARQADTIELWCDARLTAGAFYERFGMQADGAVFYKGDIAYSRFMMKLC